MEQSFEGQTERLGHHKTGEDEFENTYTGKGALGSLAGGQANTADGEGALTNCTLGNFNSAQGTNALFSLVDGSNNSASGEGALYSCVEGSDNTAIGNEAGHSQTSNQSTYVGDSAGHNHVGQQAVFIGHRAGWEQTSGDLTLFIGVEEFSIIRGDMTPGAQTLALYQGTTPVAQAAAITSPAAELAALKKCCDELRLAIKGIGITK